MPLANEGHQAAGSIDNDREQPQNVAAQDIHIERFQIGETGVLASKRGDAGSIVEKADRGLDRDRLRRASHAADPVNRLREIEPKEAENRGT